MAGYRDDFRGPGVLITEAAFGLLVGRLHHLGVLNMLTVPALTLVLLGIVVSLGAAVVWILWEIEQTVSRPHRNSDRAG
jgi:hypothetical protein